MHNDSQLTWKDGQPYSTIFEDIYFSQDHGMQETEYVFLQQNQLEQRWQHLDKTHFTIIETGFGTGLNFLSSCQLWLKTSQAHQRLHFISCEQYPLSLAQMQQAHALWPELADISAALLEQYAYLGQGFHRFHLFHQRISLTLFIGDVMEMMKQLHSYADAWFLDGFAPAKNPTMWQREMFDWMARHSQANTTFATFTAAGEVKRGLQNAGFVVNKIAGFGKKREMLSGHFSADTIKARPTASLTKSQSAIVLGAGVSGLTSAHALAKRGWQCTVIEQHHDIAQEASGNPVAVLYPKPNDGDNPLNQIAITSYQYSLAWLQQLHLSPQDCNFCGILQLAENDAEAKRFESIAKKLPTLTRWVSAEQATEIAGVKIHQPALYYPDSGWIRPQQLCRRLAQDTGIDFQFHQHALRIEQIDLGWRVWDGTRIVGEAEVLILANAYHIADFTHTQHCELTPVSGQISFLPSSPQLEKLTCVVCADAYLTPNIDQYHSLGATFEPFQTDISVTEEAHRQNLESLKNILPEMDTSEFNTKNLQGRSAIRSCSFDYLPFVGAVIDTQNMPSQTAFLRDKSLLPPLLRGLYIHAGHGAKGLLQAPLCAEILACQINAEPMPVGLDLLAALNPNRQLLKKLGLKAIKQQYQDPLLSNVQSR